MFCYNVYFSLTKALHWDQETQLEFILMVALCQQEGINKIWTTRYHPQGYGLMERNNLTKGDTLRALLLTKAKRNGTWSCHT